MAPPPLVPLSWTKEVIPRTSPPHHGMAGTVWEDLFYPDPWGTGSLVGTGFEIPMTALPAWRVPPMYENPDHIEALPFYVDGVLQYYVPCIQNIKYNNAYYMQASGLGGTFTSDYFDLSATGEFGFWVDVSGGDTNQESLMSRYSANMGVDIWDENWQHGIQLMNHENRGWYLYAYGSNYLETVLPENFNWIRIRHIDPLTAYIEVSSTRNADVWTNPFENNEPWLLSEPLQSVFMQAAGGGGGAPKPEYQDRLTHGWIYGFYEYAPLAGYVSHPDAFHHPVTHHPFWGTTYEVHGGSFPLHFSFEPTSWTLTVGNVAAESSMFDHYKVARGDAFHLASYKVAGGGSFSPAGYRVLG